MKPRKIISMKDLKEQIVTDVLGPNNQSAETQNAIVPSVIGGVQKRGDIPKKKRKNKYYARKSKKND